MKRVWMWILAAGCCSCGIYYAAAGRSPAYAAGQKAPGDAQPAQANDGSVGAEAGNSRSDGFATIVKPMIKADCATCHNSVKLKGDLDLERFLTEQRRCAERT